MNDESMKQLVAFIRPATILKMHTGKRVAACLAAAVAFLLAPAVGSAQMPVEYAIPPETSEATIVQRLGEFAQQFEQDRDPVPLEVQALKAGQALSFADALLERFPESAHREDATMVKLAALGVLARTQPQYLTRLSELTESVPKTSPSRRLAAENAYFAIQVFVLGARAERMPERRRLEGTVERYEAFLADYPESARYPVIAASLARNYIALGSVDQAKAVLDKLERSHPRHAATRRARGELYRVTGIGRPFALEYVTPNGERVRSRDFLGKVVVVHFWATWNAASVEELALLRDLNERLAPRGLQLVGVNVDHSRAAVQAVLDKNPLPWPHYFDEKGLENDLLISTGVVRIPTYLIVDRAGILQAVDPGREMPTIVERLIEEDAPARSPGP